MHTLLVFQCMRVGVLTIIQSPPLSFDACCIVCTPMIARVSRVSARPCGGSHGSLFWVGIMSTSGRRSQMLTGYAATGDFCRLGCVGLSFSDFSLCRCLVVFYYAGCTRRLVCAFCDRCLPFVIYRYRATFVAMAKLMCKYHSISWGACKQERIHCLPLNCGALYWSLKGEVRPTSLKPVPESVISHMYTQAAMYVTCSACCPATHPLLPSSLNE